MNLIACDGTWQQSAEGYLSCAGTLQVVPDTGLTAEDAFQLSDWAMSMLIAVFCVLILKRAI